MIDFVLYLDRGIGWKRIWDKFLISSLLGDFLAASQSTPWVIIPKSGKIFSTTRKQGSLEPTEPTEKGLNFKSAQPFAQQFHIEMAAPMIFPVRLFSVGSVSSSELCSRVVYLTLLQ